jgi:hypothetical protein
MLTHFGQSIISQALSGHIGLQSGLFLNITFHILHRKLLLLALSNLNDILVARIQEYKQRRILDHHTSKSILGDIFDKL